MARTTSKTETVRRNETRESKAKPIGKTATGKPTHMGGGKDKVDEAAEASFPASDPPAAAASPPANPPGTDISPARFLNPQELAKRKPR